MKTAIRTFVGWAARIGVTAEVLMITFSAGAIAGMVPMALAMTLLTNADEAARLAEAIARSAL